MQIKCFTQFQHWNGLAEESRTPFQNRKEIIPQKWRIQIVLEIITCQQYNKLDKIAKLKW